MSGALHGPGKVLVLEMTLQIDETGRGITEWKLLADFKVERISIIMPLRSSEEERAILLKGTTEISIEGSEGVRSRTGVIDESANSPFTLLSCFEKAKWWYSNRQDHRGCAAA